MTHNNNDGVYRLPLFEQRRDEILFHSLAILWLKFPLFAQRQTTAVLRFFKNMIYKQITISRGRTTAALRFFNSMINKQMTTCGWKKKKTQNKLNFKAGEKNYIENFKIETQNCVK